MNTRVATAVTAGVAALVLTACAQGAQQAGHRGSSAPTGEQPSTSAPSPSTAATSTSSSSPTPSMSTSESAAPTCTTAHLKVSLAKAEGAAGSTYDTVRLTNTGAATCSLDGYPGVSLVGKGNGTQIGASAKRDASVHAATVTVRPTASTTFVVRLAQAGNYPRSTCSPVAADGLRIFPPGSTAALYLPLKDATGCAKTSVDLLTVRPVGRTA